MLCALPAYSRESVLAAFASVGSDCLRGIIQSLDQHLPRFFQLTEQHYCLFLKVFPLYHPSLEVVYQRQNRKFRPPPLASSTHQASLRKTMEFQAYHPASSPFAGPAPAPTSAWLTSAKIVAVCISTKREYAWSRCC